MAKSLAISVDKRQQGLANAIPLFVRLLNEENSLTFLTLILPPHLIFKRQHNISCDRFLSLTPVALHHTPPPQNDLSLTSYKSQEGQELPTPLRRPGKL